MALVTPRHALMHLPSSFHVFLPSSRRREEEEKSDNMKQLENRTLDSKIELEIMDALDEIKAVNRRHETVNTEDVLKASAARRNKSVADKVSCGAGVLRICSCHSLPHRYVPHAS